MLFTSRSSGPKTSVGRTIACDSPDSRNARSTRALPRKYGSGESSLGFETLTWTTRRTPASSAARKSAALFATARANETGPPCSSHLRQAVRRRLHLFHVMLGLGDDLAEVSDSLE